MLIKRKVVIIVVLVVRVSVKVCFKVKIDEIRVVVFIGLFK